jgi:hypothetical protein
MKNMARMSMINIARNPSKKDASENFHNFVNRPYIRIRIPTIPDTPQPARIILSRFLLRVSSGSGDVTCK